MARKSIRIRAEISGDVTEVKSLMDHPQETKPKKTEPAK